MCFHHTAWKLPRKRRAPGQDSGHSSEMSHFHQAAGVTPEKAHTGKPRKMARVRRSPYRPLGQSA